MFEYLKKYIIIDERSTFMLKILSLKINGYKLLDNNFSLDFKNLSRVNEFDKTHEAIELEKGLYVFNTYSFVGGNASGKSTVLLLLIKIFYLLQTGRWTYNQAEFRNEEVKLSVEFYLEEEIYLYSCKFVKPIENINDSSAPFAEIKDEKLIKYKFKKTKVVELSDIFKYSLFDTSAIIKITKDKILFDYFYGNNFANINGTLASGTFFKALTIKNKKLLMSVIILLDESIEKLDFISETEIHFKRSNLEEKIINSNELVNILSSGTIRGIELYLRSIEALKLGKTILIDEIEDSFHKNLVNNIIALFSDSSVNTSSAQLIFSTHYVEILDRIDRRDNIFITNKVDGYIKATNLYSYNVRSEILKSKLFDNNVFNTGLNYETLMEVKRNIKDEIYLNND